MFHLLGMSTNTTFYYSVEKPKITRQAARTYRFIEFLPVSVPVNTGALPELLRQVIRFVQRAQRIDRARREVDFVRRVRVAEVTRVLAQARLRPVAVRATARAARATPELVVVAVLLRLPVDVLPVRQFRRRHDLHRLVDLRDGARVEVVLFGLPAALVDDFPVPGNDHFLLGDRGGFDAQGSVKFHRGFQDPRLDQEGVEEVARRDLTGHQGLLDGPPVSPFQSNRHAIDEEDFFLADGRFLFAVNHLGALAQDGLHGLLDLGVVHGGSCGEELVRAGLGEGSRCC